MAVVNYDQARAVITEGVDRKAVDILISEISNVQNIVQAYQTAMKEILKDATESWNKIVTKGKPLTDTMKAQFYRDIQLNKSIEDRLKRLGVNVNRISEQSFIEAVGIADQYTLDELRAVSLFENLNPKSFAILNPSQSEVAVSQTLEKTKFFNENARQDALKKLRQDLRIATIKGESIPQIRDRFMKSAGFSPARATMNARWGIIESSNKAAEWQYGDFNERVSKAGIDVKLDKQAIAHLDNRTTLCCTLVHGQIKKLDEPFETLNGDIMEPPFHVHCRTSVSAWNAMFEQYGKNTEGMLKDSEKWKDKKLSSMKEAKKAGYKPLEDIPVSKIKDSVDATVNAVNEVVFPVNKNLSGHSSAKYSFNKKVDKLISDAKGVGYELSKSDASDIVNSAGSWAASSSNIRAASRGEKEFTDFMIRNAKKAGVEVDDYYMEYIGNEYLAYKRTADNVEKFSKLSNTFDIDKAYGQQLYRGTKDTYERYKKLQVGNIIDMDGPSSFASTQEVSMGFMYRKGDFEGIKDVQFVIDKQVDNSASLTHILGGDYRNEAEVIVGAENKFKIIDIKKVKDIRYQGGAKEFLQIVVEPI